MESPYLRYFDATPCYLTVQDREFRIRKVNRSFRRMFGNGVGEFCYRLGRAYEENGDLELARAEFERALAELRLVRSDRPTREGCRSNRE